MTVGSENGAEGNFFSFSDLTGSPVYVNENSEWKRVQDLRPLHASQIKAFIFEQTTHLAVATYADTMKGIITVDAYSYIYRWIGK